MESYMGLVSNRSFKRFSGYEAHFFLEKIKVFMKQYRYDTISLPIKKMTLTPEGYLQGDAFLTKTGVFPYRNQDGSIRYELRHPDEVFLPESMNSMKMKPATWEHPASLVDADNHDWLAIGMLGENIRKHSDNTKIVGPIIITNSDKVDSIITREKIEISMGYELVLIKEDGNYNGVPYTHRQTQIFYNHAAVTKEGRAGKDVKLVLDSLNKKDKVEVSFNTDVADGIVQASINKDNTMYEVTINGVTYKCDSKEIQLEVANLRKNVDTLTSEKAEIAKNIDALTATVAEVKKLNEDSEKKLKDELDGRSDAVNSAVVERVALIEKAKPFVGDSIEIAGKKVKLVNADTKDIKLAVITKKYKNFDAKEDVKIDARFDCVIEDGVKTSNNDKSDDGMSQQRAAAFNSDADDTENFDSEDADKRLDAAEKKVEDRREKRRDRKNNVRK